MGARAYRCKPRRSRTHYCAIYANVMSFRSWTTLRRTARKAECGWNIARSMCLDPPCFQKLIACVVWGVPTAFHRGNDDYHSVASPKTGTIVLANISALLIARLARSKQDLLGGGFVPWPWRPPVFRSWPIFHIMWTMNESVCFTSRNDSLRVTKTRSFNFIQAGHLHISKSCTWAAGPVSVHPVAEESPLDSTRTKIGNELSAVRHGSCALPRRGYRCTWEPDFVSLKGPWLSTGSKLRSCKQEASLLDEEWL